MVGQRVSRAMQVALAPLRRPDPGRSRLLFLGLKLSREVLALLGNRNLITINRHARARSSASSSWTEARRGWLSPLGKGFLTGTSEPGAT